MTQVHCWQSKSGKWRAYCPALHIGAADSDRREALRQVRREVENEHGRTDDLQVVEGPPNVEEPTWMNSTSS
jgi:hypothetical protein